MQFFNMEIFICNVCNMLKICNLNSELYLESYTELKYQITCVVIEKAFSLYPSHLKPSKNKSMLFQFPVIGSLVKLNSFLYFYCLFTF
jgi:hypothetical protein